MCFELYLLHFLWILEQIKAFLVLVFSGFEEGFVAEHVWMFCMLLVGGCLYYFVLTLGCSTTNLLNNAHIHVLKR